jgi:pyruvate formate lyase activating enzyme
MIIKGFQKFSLIDYPGKVSAIVFTFGCNFRCPFCHNRELVIASEEGASIPEEEIFSHLEKRRGMLEGLVITGGEPLLQGDLPQFLAKVKEMGLAVKLDTNGSHPKLLQGVVDRGLVDFVAMDIKAPLGKQYQQATGSDCSGKEVFKSAQILIREGVDFELRTTVIPRLHKEEDLIAMARQISKLIPSSASLKWSLQQFRPQNCLNPSFNNAKPYSEKELEGILVAVRKFIPKAELRGV